MTRDLFHLGIPLHGLLGVLAVCLAIASVHPRFRPLALLLWVPVVLGLAIYPAFRTFDKPLLDAAQLAAFERKEYVGLSAVALSSAGFVADRLGQPPLAMRLLLTGAAFATITALLGVYSVWGG